MAPSPEFAAVFSRLKDILARHAGTLTPEEDTPTRYALHGGLHPTHQEPMPIAWVEIRKSYVSYHLMPVYGHPKLLDGFSATLRARMQGKSCFNFKAVDDPLFEELERLTVAGFEAFRRAGFMP